MEIDSVTGQEIHPDALRILSAMRELGRPLMETLDPETARAQMRAMRAALKQQQPPMASVEDRAAVGPHGAIPVRVYRPHAVAEDRTAPVVMFFHGGGWVVGDLETHDGFCRHLANAAEAVVVAVDYRLAPEHKFPAAADDCIAATQWVAARAAELGVDAGRLAVAGDSAGGNLATVVALACAASGPKIVAQILVYPAVDMRLASPSFTRVGTGFTLTGPAMDWFRDHYLDGAHQIEDWRASPIVSADLGKTPRAYVTVATLDPLHDEGEAYAKALEAAGVPVTFHRAKGHMHGFIGLHGIASVADEVTREIGAFLKGSWGIV